MAGVSLSNNHGTQACAYIRDNGDSSKGKRRRIVGKDRRKVGKKLPSRGTGEGSPLEVRYFLMILKFGVAWSSVEVVFSSFHSPQAGASWRSC